jgi:hypothetical protein
MNAFCKTDEDCMTLVCDPNMLGVGGLCAEKTAAAGPSNAASTDAVTAAATDAVTDAVTAAVTAAVTEAAKEAAAQAIGELVVSGTINATLAATPTFSPTPPEALQAMREIHMDFNFISYTASDITRQAPSLYLQEVFALLLEGEVSQDEGEAGTRGSFRGRDAHNISVNYGPIRFIELAAGNPITEQMLVFDDDGETRMTVGKRYASEIFVTGVLDQPQMKHLVEYLGSPGLSADLVAGIQKVKAAEKEAGVQDQYEISDYSSYVQNHDGSYVHPGGSSEYESAIEEMPTSSISVTLQSTSERPRDTSRFRGAREHERPHSGLVFSAGILAACAVLIGAALWIHRARASEGAASVLSAAAIPLTPLVVVRAAGATKTEGVCSAAELL